MARLFRIPTLFRWYPLLLVALPLCMALFIAVSFQAAEQNRRLAVDSAAQVTHEASQMVRQRLLSVVEQQLVAAGASTALQVESLMQRAISVTSTLANVLSSMKEVELAADVGSESVNRILMSLLDNNPDFQAIYTIWEPGIISTSDSTYADVPGYDASGHYAPYWYRKVNGTIELKVAHKYAEFFAKTAVNGGGDFYQRIRKESKAPIQVLWQRQPEQGTASVITVSVPIIMKQRVVGVAGIDLAVKRLQLLMDLEASKGLDPELQLALVSAEGSIVAISGSRNRIGTMVSRQFTDSSYRSQQFRELSDNSLSLLQPLFFGDNVPPWGVYITLPRKQVEASTRSIHQEMLAEVRQLENSLIAQSRSNLWRQGAITLVLILCILLIFRLMRALEHREGDLRRSENRVQALLDNTTAMIYMKDLDGRYVMVNQRWLELFHFTMTQALGQTDSDLFPVEIAGKYHANDIKAVEQHRAIEFEEEALQDDGLHTYISLKIPLFDSKGRCYATCGVSTDITERKKAEEEVQRLNTKLKSRTRELTEALTLLTVEQQKSEQLLLNILPEPIAKRLRKGEDTIADSFVEVTILFADIVNFMHISVDLSSRELVTLLNEIFSEFDRLCGRRGLEKIKTIGDAYMVVAGLPVTRDDHAAVIADMALDMLVAIEEFNCRHGTHLSIRIGVNSGPVVAGVIGTRKFIYDVWGEAVNVAARMESHGLKNRIQVTESTYDNLKSQFEFEDRGLLEIKGKGKMHTYFLNGPKRSH
ncbi:adenylate/guanylate cyclase domain-containing protein [Amphritea sp. HPY]|uniref:adenylate/guanylate cyclase domain-containing protein n=1 Tax=Amphritea sp. HPY TaxID=3421652 RepID=UPI003D7D3D5F